MVITYGAQISARLSNPKLCFISIPDLRELEGYSQEKILEPVNHPSQDIKLNLVYWQ